MVPLTSARPGGLPASLERLLTDLALPRKLFLPRGPLVIECLTAALRPLEGVGGGRGGFDLACGWLAGPILPGRPARAAPIPVVLPVVAILGTVVDDHYG